MEQTNTLMLRIKKQAGHGNKCKYDGKKGSTHLAAGILPLLLLSVPQQKPIEASTNLKKEAGV
jgi:hypothetical protein